MIQRPVVEHVTWDITYRVLSPYDICDIPCDIRIPIDLELDLMIQGPGPFVDKTIVFLISSLSLRPSLSLSLSESLSLSLFSLSLLFFLCLGQVYRPSDLSSLPAHLALPVSPLPPESESSIHLFLVSLE